MKSKKGLTLVELLVVIALISLLMLLVVPNVLKLYNNGKKNAFYDEIINLYSSSYSTYLLRSSEGDYRKKFCVGQDSETSTFNPLEIASKKNLWYDIDINDDGDVIGFKAMNKDYYIELSSTEVIKKKNLKNAIVENNSNNSILCSDDSGSDDSNINDPEWVVPSEIVTLLDAIKRDNPKVKIRNSFDSLDYSEDGVETIFLQSSTVTSQMTEDIDGDGLGENVYYFAGNKPDNWLKLISNSSKKCLYQGNNVNYLDILTGETLTPTSESECFSSNVCNYNGGYYVGFDDMSLCLKMGGTDTGSTATYDSTSIYSYWRIIRINEDKSIRLIYAGTDTTASDAFIGVSDYDENYVGYMYDPLTTNGRGTSTSSTIKTYIDNWYKNTLLTNFDKYISKTAIYCNDRSITIPSDLSGNPAYYGAYTRLNINKTPTYKCGGNGTGGLFESTQSLKDKFSVSTSSGGNGALTYPIALITADELVYAGLIYGQSEYNWLGISTSNTSPTGTNNWWTMTPHDSKSLDMVVSIVSDSPPSIKIDKKSLADAVVRPVISLKSCTTWVSGDGRPSNPYVVSVSETCASAEN